ncbi:MAG: histone deacetylase [Candidatus Brocadiaceae bacterium]|nr:histone deacetylase [Candidatus Brocadiaceae bacterium]
MTVLIYDDIFLKHNTGYGHPENAKRLEKTLIHLESSEIWKQLTVEVPCSASTEELGSIHSPSYTEFVKRIANNGGGWLDSDTVVSVKSYNAAIHATGALLTATDLIIRGGEKNGFCLVRPPGHHATPKTGMGFCLFNNAAIAARYIQSKYHMKKILIVDWDVHHGNGTQDAFYEDPTVLYFSMHRYPFYPGTGRKEEEGRGAGKGFTINVPLPADTKPPKYIELFTDAMHQKISPFKPDFIIISAGFDAYRNDPIGGLNLEIADFHTLTEIVVQFAEKHCNGRLVSCLEGGYNITELPLCIEAHLKALLHE